MSTEESYAKRCQSLDRIAPDKYIYSNSNIQTHIVNKSGPHALFKCRRGHRIYQPNSFTHAYSIRSSTLNSWENFRKNDNNNNRMINTFVWEELNKANERRTKKKVHTERDHHKDHSCQKPLQ